MPGYEPTSEEFARIPEGICALIALFAMLQIVMSYPFEVIILTISLFGLRLLAKN
jgi:hypothetical protein